MRPLMATAPRRRGEAGLAYGQGPPRRFTRGEMRRWPAELRKAKAVFLAKKQALSLDPTDYRVLLILPSIYRLWAKTRARQLRGWMAGWRGRQQHTKQIDEWINRERRQQQ